MKSFSELTSASHVNNSDILAISQENSGTYSSKKTTVKEVSDFANQNLAEEYDSTSSYAVGDYVIYESVLYKCTASTTGSFDNTKWTTVVVTDEMGSGGGGTGGHTIIDENGNSMTARAGLQFVGGANVSDDSTNNKTIVDLASAGGIDGVFFDTGNIIVQETSISASGLSYTATEDCYVVLFIIGNDTVYINVDGEYVAGNFSLNVNDRQTFQIPLKKGQTLTTTSGSTNNTYIVYGIQTGTTHSKFQPVIITEDERKIGVYKDGKPLYQQTLVVANVGSIGTQIITPIQINDVPFDYIDVVDANIYDSNDNRRYNVPNLPKDTADRIFMHPYLNKSSNPVVFYLSLYSGGTTYSNMTDLNVTIQYTKSTDVAGSGSWTPQGVPAHHYSTDEHIVGTWIDGETLYERTFYMDDFTGVTLSGFNIASGLTGIDKAWITEGSIKNNDGNTFKLDNYLSSNAYAYAMYQSTGNIRAVTNGFNPVYLFVTLQYTKSS